MGQPLDFTRLAGVFPSVDARLMGQSRMALLRSGSQLDMRGQVRDPFASGSFRASDFRLSGQDRLGMVQDRRAAMQANQMGEDLMALEREQNRFDRDFYEDPLTGKLRPRRTASHQEGGFNFQLLGSGAEGDDFRLDISRPEAAGFVDPKFRDISDEVTAGRGSKMTTFQSAPLLDLPQQSLLDPNQPDEQPLLPEDGGRTSIAREQFVPVITGREKISGTEQPDQETQDRILEQLKSEFAQRQGSLSERQARLDALRTGGRRGLQKLEAKQKEKRDKVIRKTAEDIVRLQAKSAIDVLKRQSKDEDFLARYKTSRGEDFDLDAKISEVNDRAADALSGFALDTGADEQYLRGLRLEMLRGAGGPPSSQGDDLAPGSMKESERVRAIQQRLEAERSRAKAAGAEQSEASLLREMRSDLDAVALDLPALSKTQARTLNTIAGTLNAAGTGFRVDTAKEQQALQQLAEFPEIAAFIEGIIPDVLAPSRGASDAQARKQRNLLLLALAQKLSE